MMRRPLHIRLLPDRFKASAFYRFYNPLPPRWNGLLEQAPLAFAPSVSMVALMPGDIISGCIALTGHYELSLSRKLVAMANRGGRLVDVGANLGYFSLLWLAAKAENTCISVEASPRNVPLLKQNIDANSFGQRCQIEHCAAGDQTGVMPFDLGPGDQSGWGGLAVETSATSIDVTVRRLDDLVTDDAPIDVLKIDVEGADTLVIRGAEKLLRRHQVKTVFYEQNNTRLGKFGVDVHEANEFFKSLGYTIRVVENSAAGIVEYAATLDDSILN